MYARDHAGIATPIGTVRVEGGDTVTGIWIGRGAPARGHAPAVIEAAEQLERWFAGELRDFDLALEPALTPRGQELRDFMVAIPYGETLTYGAFATATDSMPRAIGQVCARNPFPIIVPCHRVTAAGGKLGYYSGGDGPNTKAWLLAHEQRHTGALLL